MDPASHELRYVLDPGIGGRVHEYRGKPIPRLDSPKATIMALITDGILTHKLPWALVLLGVFITVAIELDRKSTRLNSSHSQISYAVFCLKKKKQSKLTSLEPWRTHPAPCLISCRS